MNDLFVIKALEKINLLMIIYTSSFWLSAYFKRIPFNKTSSILFTNI